MREEITLASVKMAAAGTGTTIAISDPAPTILVLGMTLGDWAAFVTIIFVVFQIVDLAPKVIKQKIIPFVKRLLRR